jgi:hypothetical protein
MTSGRPPSRPSFNQTGGDAEAAQVVDVDVLHLRLPCRCFQVSYKVAEPGKFSLTTEFLLRLLRFADGLKEEAVAEFFGFVEDEARFVIDHAERFGYVARLGGRICLTEAGNNLFNVGDGEPALFEVQTKRDRFDFDLIAFAPAERQQFVSPFEFELPELPLQSVQEAANASGRVSSSLKRYFREFQFKQSRSRSENQLLYTVDDVQPEKRFSMIVPMTIGVRSDSPSLPEVNLHSWKTGVELEDRSAVVQSCASIVRDIRVSGGGLTHKAAQCLANCAPEQVSRFIREQGFDPEAYFRATVRQIGELRSDRPTVRVIGNIWTEANRIRLASALRSAGDRGLKPPTMVLWLRPSLPFWGMTARLPETLEAVVKHFAPADGEQRLPLRSALISDEDWPRLFTKAFNAIVDVPAHRLPQGLEVFLVPGRLAFVLVHTPIGIDEGFPIALGVASFDLKVVERVHAVVTDILSGAFSESLHCDWATDHLLDELDAALDFSSSIEPKGQ